MSPSLRSSTTGASVECLHTSLWPSLCLPGTRRRSGVDKRISTPSGDERNGVMDQRGETHTQILTLHACPYIYIYMYISVRLSCAYRHIPVGACTARVSMRSMPSRHPHDTIWPRRRCVSRRSVQARCARSSRTYAMATMRKLRQYTRA